MYVISIYGGNSISLKCIYHRGVVVSTPASYLEGTIEFDPKHTILPNFMVSLSS
jgi:hypothetical protein